MWRVMYLLSLLPFWSWLIFNVWWWHHYILYTLLSSSLIYCTFAFPTTTFILIIKGARQRDCCHWFFKKRHLPCHLYCILCLSVWFPILYIELRKILLGSCNYEWIISCFSFSNSNVSEYFETHFEKHLLMPSVSLPDPLNRISTIYITPLIYACMPTLLPFFKPLTAALKGWIDAGV